MKPQTLKFPFTAVSGQASFKLALILAAINPALGGVLISGPRGSAKSTLARGLADVMPASANKPHEFVTLPLGASEEMLVGTLDLQKVLADQSVSFQPGLLAKADGGVLYVDEVNLLSDNLVDLLLDVSASGVNVVERDGVSHSHSAEFILLGTMNPDEGELRPQLLDRFGLSVELSNQYSVEERVEIVRLREAFDRNPEVFVQDYQKAQATLTESIQTARTLLNQVQCADELRILIAEKCVEAHVDGMRGDIVWYRAAVAHAAWHRRDQVTEEDILAVEELVLAHRRQNSSNSSNPPHFPNSNSQRPESSDTPSRTPFSRPQESKNQQTKEGSEGDWGSMSSTAQEQQTVEASWQLNPLNKKAEKRSAKQSSLGKPQTLSSGRQKGIGSKGVYASKTDDSKVHWFGSMVKNAGQIPLKELVFRKKRESQPVLHLVLLDTSASILQHQNFAKAKSLVSAIANQAYLAREQMTLMGFGNQKVETLLPKKRAPKSLITLLNTIPAAGGTPLREMLQQAKAFQQQQVTQIPNLLIKTYLITDGRTSQAFDDLDLLGQVTVVDTEDSQVKRGKALHIAQSLVAEYFKLTDLSLPEFTSPSSHTLKV
ncbi:AAA family ATPase [Litoribrevibacter albus]|uniref:AAA+ ATPase domain-containing protein n=1 Tax=Litoribrevibacter albus TaxID=1473156 RepID=A0AA37S7X3_9GAMM|nr:AAA family ATPase [Litoribrevibacter albus]GLQ29942.1 hypothetical protein GCM10007876_04200 [Litoribrevibacter albus]